MSYIIIYYGPYLSHGIIDHRIHRVNGLFRALNELGYEIELAEINEYNRLSIEMYEREIFRCDIRNLMFNMPIEDDIVCQRAVKAIEDARRRMSGEDNVPEFDSMGNEARNLNMSFDEDEFENNSEDVNAQMKGMGCDVSRDHDSAAQSLGRHILNRDISKSEQKMSKVKIMEDKNTTILTESSVISFEDANGENN